MLIYFETAHSTVFHCTIIVGEYESNNNFNKKRRTRVGSSINFDESDWCRDIILTHLRFISTHWPRKSVSQISHFLSLKFPYQVTIFHLLKQFLTRLKYHFCIFEPRNCMHSSVVHVFGLNGRRSQERTGFTGSFHVWSILLSFFHFFSANLSA